MTPTINDYFEWDVITWSRALDCWNKYFSLHPLKSNSIALEIGGRSGGLSLYLAHEKSLNTICSDLFNPKEIAQKLHLKYGVSNLITYEAQNCLSLSYDDCTFDVIIFKSVIGALGNHENQRQAISEIYRCLKPGGVLLFAENGRSTKLHGYLRKKFNNWSANYWYYPTLIEMNYYLANFSYVDIHTNGFLSTFFRNKYFKKVAEYFDIFIVKITPSRFHYVQFGTAIK